MSGPPPQTKGIITAAASRKDQLAKRDLDNFATVKDHFALLGGNSKAESNSDHINDATSAPLFTKAVRNNELNSGAIFFKKSEDNNFSQYGLLGGVVKDSSLKSEFALHELSSEYDDPRIFQNVAAPMSAFICGSQGSGKSHTLSCMLENCLLNSSAGTLPRPLTGLVFHYDSFVSDTGGSPCEAAYLSSHHGVKVRVLCPPTNIVHIKRIYSSLPNVVVEELRINQTDLNTKRMLDLMAFNAQNGSPLYLHVINRILRNLRIEQQLGNTRFDYTKFKERLFMEDLSEAQVSPLKQRLETLESFMVAEQANAYNAARVNLPPPKKSAPKRGGMSSQGTLSTRSAPDSVAKGHDWTPKPGHLTVVDLSCPCVTAEMACSLFNICLSLFLEQPSKVGRVVALDEAHKYMGDSAESGTLTDSLISAIRLQRHVGARIIIATQEPTISPKLLDLCSVTIVHRFTSPDWLEVLRKHLAGANHKSIAVKGGAHNPDEESEEFVTEGIQPLIFTSDDVAQEIFSRIINLNTGEALVFSPTAAIGIRKPVRGESDVTTTQTKGKTTSPDTPGTTASSDSSEYESDETEYSEDETESVVSSSGGSRFNSANSVAGYDDDNPAIDFPTLFPTQSQPPRQQKEPKNKGAYKFGAPTGKKGFNFNVKSSPTTIRRALSKQDSAGTSNNYAKAEPVRLGRGVLRVRIRSRVTTDGGKSIFAT